ncbi:TonB family protein [Chitinophagaceae bacterium MMS25-I14]
MNYLLLVLLYTAVMLGVYYLLLRNKAVHSFNRLYLLVCTMLPLGLPFIKLPSWARAGTNVPAIIRLLPDVTISAGPVNQASAFSVINYLAAAALLISAILLIRLGMQYLQLWKTLKGKPFELQGNLKLYRSSGMGPGSWRKHIFFPGAEADAVVLKHEKAHITFGHSNDLMFVQILQCICWPNVLLHLILRELRVVHEFQADEAAAAETGVKACSVAILNETFHTAQFSISHQFFQHPLKRRISMLQKTTNNRRRLLTILSAVCIAFCFTGTLMWVQHVKEKQAVNDRKSSFARRLGEDEVKEWAVIAVPANNVPKGMAEEAAAALTQFNEEQPDTAAKHTGSILDRADKMPEYPGSPDALIGFLTSNIRYPDSARKHNIEGRVVIRFVVEKDGGISDATVIKGVHPVLDAEALRVVNSMPKWKPGVNKGKPVPVYFFLPVTFKLEG